MPCRHYTPEEELGIAQNHAVELKAELDRTTRLLCSVCRTIDADGSIEDLMFLDGLSDWWEEHQVMDKKRIAAEQLARKELEKKKEEERITEQIRQTALEKLTAHEIIALGIRRDV